MLHLALRNILNSTLLTKDKNKILKDTYNYSKVSRLEMIID